MAAKVLVVNTEDLSESEQCLLGLKPIDWKQSYDCLEAVNNFSREYAMKHCPELAPDPIVRPEYAK